MSILSSLITSKTRINILMRLFLNPDQQAYLRELADEFTVSTSQVSEELQQLSQDIVVVESHAVEQYQGYLALHLAQLWKVRRV